MNTTLIDDFPFYLLIFGVIGNLVIGIISKISFVNIMLRSIIVTILFSIIGYLISYVCKDFKISQINKNDKVSNTQNIDLTIPPISDEEFHKYNEDDEFIEVNPAEL